MYNLDEINGMTANAGLTSYEGDPSKGYTGFGDDFVDFGGDHLDFASEIATERVFTIVVSNTTGADATILLTPSYVPSIPANVVIEGALALAGVTATGSPKTVNEFLAFTSQNPTSIVAMKVVSTNSLQLAKVFNIIQKSPFRNLETKQIVLSSFSTEFANNDKMVTIRKSFQVDNQTELNIVVPAGATTTFTFYCGAVLNPAKALSKKSSKAGQTPAVASARAMIQAAK